MSPCIDLRVKFCGRYYDNAMLNLKGSIIRMNGQTASGLYVNGEFRSIGAKLP